VKVYAPSTAHSGGGSDGGDGGGGGGGDGGGGDGGGGDLLPSWHSTLAILSKLRRIASQTLHRAHPGCDLPRRLPRAPCVPSRIVLERSALNSPTNRATRPAIAKKTIESKHAN
jgi:hypothetical protein